MESQKLRKWLKSYGSLKSVFWLRLWCKRVNTLFQLNRIYFLLLCKVKHYFYNPFSINLVSKICLTLLNNRMYLDWSSNLVRTETAIKRTSLSRTKAGYTIGSLSQDWDDWARYAAQEASWRLDTEQMLNGQTVCSGLLDFMMLFLFLSRQW